MSGNGSFLFSFEREKGVCLYVCVCMHTLVHIHPQRSEEDIGSPGVVSHPPVWMLGTELWSSAGAVLLTAEPLLHPHPVLAFMLGKRL